MKPNPESPIYPVRRPSRQRAFTLVELLTVIAIIGVLVALLLPVANNVSRVKKVNTAQAELQGIETMLENYKAKYGFYPPCNTNNYVLNQLYYELSGVTNNNGIYQTLDGNASIGSVVFTGQFNVGGIINCSQGSGEDTTYAKNFLAGLKANEITSATNGSGTTLYFLVTSVGGPDAAYTPMEPSLSTTGNPFRYVYPGVNNPNSYDLWVKLIISGQTNLVCNWSQQVQHSTTLP